MKGPKYIIIQGVLILGIIVVSVLIYRSIMRPQKFNNIYEARKAEVVVKLKDIRSLQAYYKTEKGSYAQSFEQLRDFWNNGTMTVVVKEGNVPDTLTEAEALKMGIIKRDTVIVNAKTEMLKTLPDLDIDKFDIIPFSDGERFHIAADTIKRSNIPVCVYEVRAEKKQYLKNLDNDPRVKNAFMGTLLYSGLQEEFLGPNFDFKDNIKDIILGSLTEPSTDGNWE